MHLRMGMIGCRLAEIWRWRGEMCGQGQKIMGIKCVKNDMKLLGLQSDIRYIHKQNIERSDFKGCCFCC